MGAPYLYIDIIHLLCLTSYAYDLIKELKVIYRLSATFFFQFLVEEWVLILDNLYFL